MKSRTRSYAEEGALPRRLSKGFSRRESSPIQYGLIDKEVVCVMEGIIWLLLALIVALVALGVVVAGIRRRPPRINPKSSHCPSCLTPISLRRVPLFKSHALLGEWVCPHCGNRTRSGNGVSGTAA